MIPVVSVLMPVYNAEKYIAQAVESVLCQSFSDFEFIIIDDGSSDRSLGILQEYAGRDSRICLVSRPNTGYVIALNEMLQLAKGEFVARMDADDVCAPCRFGVQVAFLRSNPLAVCVGGAIAIIDDCDRFLTVLQPPESNDVIQEMALSGHTPITHPAAMIRRAVMSEIGGYRPEMEPAEDLDLWLRLGEHGELANVREVVLSYREHASSVSGSRQERQLQQMKRAADLASDRRGLPRRLVRPLQPFRPARDRSSRHVFALRNGWWAYNSGERQTSLIYALRAVCLVPWRSGGWRLLVCALIKLRRRNV